MSLSEKLENISNNNLIIAENQEKVYKAGQSSMVDESKIIEKTVSGEYISVDDVSEIPHEVKIKLTSGGKNLWSYFDSIETEGDGIIYTWLDHVKVDLSGHFVFSCFAEINDLTYSSTGNMIYLAVLFADGTEKYLTVVGSATTNGKVSFSIDASASSITAFSLTRHPRMTGGTIKLTNIMLEEGDTATEYEPYKETLTDYSGVSLTRCGKNLATLSDYVGKTATKNGITATIIEGGIIQVTGTPTDSAKETAITLSLPKTLQLPAGNYACDPDVVLSSNLVRAFFGAYSHDENWIKNFLTEANSIDVPFYASQITVYIKAGTVTTEVNKLLPLTLERGSKFTLTEYEPYNAQTLTANADGTVEGVKITSPYMYITTDNKNVTINATYHKSYGMQTEYDRFWDKNWVGRFANNFNMAFAGYGWNDEKFNPPENTNIIIRSANRMFSQNLIVDLEGILKKKNITIDTSQSAYNQQLFASSTYLKYAPVISTLNCPSLQETCYDCTSLERIGFILKDDGTNVFGSTFYNCKELADITFEGVIGNNMDYTQSTKLSKASILNIFEHLSSTVTGKTLTLSKTAVNNAFETSTGAADGSTSTEWTNLVATKTNWTISLV